MPSILQVKIPDIEFRVSQEIINRATPDHRGLCLGALAIRERLKEHGVQSILVTPDTVRFNMLAEVDGIMRMVRFIYIAPAPLKKAAHLFDYYADQHGAAYAREQTKPFKFRLQSRDASVSLPVVQPIGDARKKRNRNAPRTRTASSHDVVVTCARRYNPLTAYKTRKKVA